MRAYRIRQMGGHDEGERAAFHVRVVNMEREFPMRAIHRFHADGGRALLSEIPNCGIDLPRFKVLREDGFLRVQPRGEGREHGGGTNNHMETHSQILPPSAVCYAAGSRSPNLFVVGIRNPREVSGGDRDWPHLDEGHAGVV